MITGCKSDSYRSVSNKIQYDLINEVLNNYVFVPAGEDVRPVGYTGCVFQQMPGIEQIESIRTLLMEGKTGSEEDKEYMSWQLDKNWNKKLNRSLIDSYNITIIKDKGRNFDEVCNSMVLYLSPPLFTSDRQRAIIWQSLEYRGLRAQFLVILHMQKRRWVMESYEIIGE
jgi:hypothetical protein